MVSLFIAILKMMFCEPYSFRVKLGGTRIELTQKNNFPEENATELVLKLKKASLCSKYSLSKVGQT
jgi:hypothetical protein